jgi:hypothetical protein
MIQSGGSIHLMDIYHALTMKSSDISEKFLESAPVKRRKGTILK